MSSPLDASAALTPFGYTQLESLIYHELLQRSPATGYRLARLLGKAPANIYQTLKALVQKGAIVAIETAEGPQSYIAVPPRQLFGGIKAAFEDRYESNLAILNSIHSPTRDETVYQLRTVSQVFERAKAMMSQATEIVVYDMVPELYDLLRVEIDGTRGKGVNVVGIAYRPEDALPLVPYNGEAVSDVAARWPGMGLILIVDGREQLIAQISRDGEQVLNAVYSDSVFLSSILHSAVLSDIRLVALRSDASDPLEHLSIKYAAPPGLRALNERDTAGDNDQRNR